MEKKKGSMAVCEGQASARLERAKGDMRGQGRNGMEAGRGDKDGRKLEDKHRSVALATGGVCVCHGRLGEGQWRQHSGGRRKGLEWHGGRPEWP